MFKLFWFYIVPLCKKHVCKAEVKMPYKSANSTDRKNKTKKDDRDLFYSPLRIKYNMNDKSKSFFLRSHFMLQMEESI